jgi:signal transduction histidine kinase
MEQELGNGWAEGVHPEDFDRCLRTYVTAFDARENFTMMYRLRRHDGTYRYILDNGAPFYRGGEFAGYFGSCIDVTEQRATEEQLRQAQKLETVGQLTAGVAHDFNNLLTSILGSLELLETRIADESARRLLQGAIRSARRGATLNEQLLAFARKQPLVPKALNLNAVVSGMDALLRSSIGGSIRVETVPGADLWLALADQTQLELVILNLAINARDAMPVGGRIVIETRNVTRDAPEGPEEPPPGEYVAISVSDTGTGMSEEVRRKAFDPFFTTKQPGKGSGLGLNMVFGVARQSGGGVTLASKVGEGTTVTVYLPRAPADAVRDQDEGMPSPGPLVLVGDEVILLVDDDSDVREVTTALLNSIGYRVLEAGSGPAALDLLAGDERVDVMLVDIAMPGMDGIETARRVQGLRPGVPVIFATGYADLSRFAERLEPQQVVRKPYRRAELADKLRAALGSAAPRASSARQ